MGYVASIFLAAATRSGSTHIANSLVRCGFKRASVHGTVGSPNEEHSIDPVAANILFPLGGFVFQSHVRAIGRTKSLLATWKVPVVVVCRNIFDSLLSFKEQTDRDWDSSPSYADFVKSTHLGLHLPDWGSLNDTRRYMWTAKNMIPWYISFYVSWQHCGFPVCWTWYEDFFKDQPAGLTRILEWSGYPVERQVYSATEPKDGKFSVGESGRGLATLPGTVIDEVYSQISVWGVHASKIAEDLCSR